MCDFNQNCNRAPGVVVTVGPGEAVLDCCGVIVEPSFVAVNSDGIVTSS